MAFFLNELKKNGCLDDIHITIGNIGSRPSNQDDYYGAQNWHLFSPSLTILGFDADPSACEEANEIFANSQSNWNEFHIPIALSDRSGIETLYVTKEPMCSSLLEPNSQLLNRFLHLADLVALDYQEEVEISTLDVFCEIEGIQEIDFLKIDVQGAGLQVLKGSKKLLSHSVFAIQIEVEFSPLYKNEALFAEVDQYVRSQGFVLFDMFIPQRGVRSPISSQVRPGQVLWTDVIYLRDPLSLDSPTWVREPESIFKMACIADALEFTDYALELLENLILKDDCNHSQSNLFNTITNCLSAIPEIVAEGIENFPVIKRLSKYFESK
jgi:FkbM family methyltransferase